MVFSTCGKESATNEVDVNRTYDLRLFSETCLEKRPYNLLLFVLFNGLGLVPMFLTMMLQFKLMVDICYTKTKDIFELRYNRLYFCHEAGIATDLSIGVGLRLVVLFRHRTQVFE
jgi:hypothetical protein